MTTSAFEQYKCFKNKYNFAAHLINFNRVIAPELVTLIYYPEKFKQLGIIDLLKPVFKTRDLTNLANAFKENNLVATIEFDRNDYNELLDSYFKNVSKWHISKNESPAKFAFSPASIFKIFKFVFAQPGKEPFKVKFFLAATLVHYANIFESLQQYFDGINLNGKKYVPFNSAYGVDALYTQFFKLKKVSTYHITHGMNYVSYKGAVPFDALNGENITADTTLVWGQSSKDSLIDFHQKNPADIVVAGNPKYPAKIINVKQSFKKGIIFLGRAIYDDDNKNLVKLAGKVAANHNISFAFKCHPNSSQDEFRKLAAECNVEFLSKENTVTGILKSDKYDFSISYNTTAYYEAMYHNMVCFRYEVNESELFDGLDDKFNDEASLIKRLAYFESMDSSILNQQLTETLVNNLGMGIDKYGEIFNAHA